MATLLWRNEKFYSQLDEDAFFGWLQSIPAVTKVEGTPAGLVIHLRSKRLAKSDLWDIIAIYKRYGGDMTQLAQFLTKRNEHWFKSAGKYWFNSIFGRRPMRQK